MPGPEDLPLLLDAAAEAGRIALSYWKRSPRVWEKPGDQGPVTEADLAVDRALRDALGAARPDHGWLSEETPDDPAARLASDAVFILDPIDGTRAFVAGEESFAVSLALAVAGQVVAGVVHLPARDETYAAALGLPATRNGEALAPGAAGGVPRVLASRASFAPEHWRGEVPQVTRHFRPSLAWRMCLVAEGRFDAMLTLRPTWEWDIAAGALIAACAGREVSDRTGAPLRFNRADPRAAGCLVAEPGMLADWAGRLV